MALSLTINVESIHNVAYIDSKNYIIIYHSSVRIHISLYVMSKVQSDSDNQLIQRTKAKFTEKIDLELEKETIVNI